MRWINSQQSEIGTTFGFSPNYGEVGLIIVLAYNAALALTRQQRDFIEKRNASFGKRGYDLRQAMEDRLEKLNTIVRQ